MSFSGSNARAQSWQRNIRLLFDAELASGVLNAESLQGQALRRAVPASRIPSRPWRVVQQLRYRRRDIDFERAVMSPLLAVRGEVLGKNSAAPPRFLIRVDEFPHYKAADDPARFGTSSFERFHEIMLSASTPYLIAVLPRVSREPLSPSSTGSRPLNDDEVVMLKRLDRERVSFGLHGFDHRTRFVSPRRHSELSGLTADQTERLLDQGFEELILHGIRPEVFVPPFNRFDVRQFDLLARRFDVICGGPESIGMIGFQSAPQWRGEAVYLPSYAPFYGRAHEILPAAERAIEQQTGLWTPIVLHWGWEAETDWTDLQRLVSVIAPSTAGWQEFLEAVRRSR
ncbi:MAG: DUF2334 domain-containing protein [Solirubrobacteraceae bacterium]